MTCKRKTRNRHEDYVPGFDALSEGGLSGLLGGGASQVGLIVMELALLKKFGFLIILPVVWLFSKSRGKGTRV